jgi:tRNA threonylcarbamoyladenosine biosynthesis protein TsaB
VIIAVESASPDQSVALARPSGEIVADASWSAERGQGSQLLPRLLELLSDHAVPMSAVSSVAVGLGPGSFTGLRVGLALAKGLAAGLAIPIVGVPSLDAWLDAQPNAVGAVVRAGAAQAWVRARDEPEPRLVGFDAITDSSRNAELVASTDLIAVLGLERASAPTGAAAAVARRAADRLRDGSSDDLGSLEPVYLRPPRGLDDSPPVPVTWL